MQILFKWSGIVLGAMICMTLLAGLMLYPVGMEKLTRSYPGIPVEAVKIPADQDAIARGGHVATIWACTRCHGADLSGTSITSDPSDGSIPIFGTIPASNLTSGKGGIASAYIDTDWIRAIRHGVKPNGQIELFMYNYSSMSDQDLGDLIAYLKRIPPIDTDDRETRLGAILPIAPAIGMYTPAAELIDHNAPRSAEPTPGATKEYGRYLSAICTACHFGNSVARKLDKWSQEDFVRTIRTGVVPNGKRLGSTMSSKTFSEMSDMELAALWLFFVEDKP